MKSFTSVSITLFCLSLDLVYLLYFCLSLDISQDINKINKQRSDLARKGRGNAVIESIANVLVYFIK